MPMSMSSLLSLRYTECMLSKYINDMDTMLYVVQIIDMAHCTVAPVMPTHPQAGAEERQSAAQMSLTLIAF